MTNRFHNSFNSIKDNLSQKVASLLHSLSSINAPSIISKKVLQSLSEMTDLAEKELLVDVVVNM